jgi:hypothetical protein
MRSIFRLIALIVSSACLAAACRSDAPPGAQPTPWLTGDVPIAGGYFEASAVVRADKGRGVLFADDDRTREIMWIDFDQSGSPRAAVPIPISADITDPEGMTTDGRYTYVVGSQSKLTGADGDGLVRFVFDPETMRVRELESLRNFKAFLAAEVDELSGIAGKQGDHVINIESIAWDPAGTRLLLGLRAPLVEGDALVVPLVFRDPAAGLTAENLFVPDRRAIRLPLGGAGIRSLEFDPVSGTFHVISGAHLDEERLTFRLFAWDGRTGSAPQETGVFPKGLKPEGLTRVKAGTTERLMIVYDTSRYMLVDQR